MDKPCSPYRSATKQDENPRPAKTDIPLYRLTARGRYHRQDTLNMNTIAQLNDSITSTRAELAALDAEHTKVLADARAAIAQADAILARTDDAVRAGLDDGTSSARRIRAERQEATSAKARAEATVTAWDRSNQLVKARLQTRLNELRAALPVAEHATLTTSQLERATKDARFRLTAARDELTAAQDGVDHYRARLAEAHDATDRENDAVHALAELTGEREALQANAFIDGRKPDAGKLADLDRRAVDAEKDVDAAKGAATGARAAVDTLEGLIVSQQSKVAEAVDRVAAAEAGVLAAVRAQVVRQITDLVDALRAPLEQLEAVDPALGARLVHVLRTQGLHTIDITGQILRPKWLPAVAANLASEHAENVKVIRSRVLSGEVTPATADL